MAIPLHLQQFKAAGIYRVVFDKSTILNQDTELLRLVVGYSEQGPFNVPVYVKDPQTFTALFGGINKKLEKRGVFFHRLALQMLQVSPCLVLNLKKFSNETVGGATISTQFNPTFEPINDVKLKVEDIYDTTRFWTLDAEKLNGLRSAEGATLDQYINIATTNTKKTSATVFIRKASGLKVSGYNITVNDWYSDNPSLMPDYLAPYKNSLISDFFAEIYVFSGQFTPKQVLASDTLKNYFIVSKNETTGELELKLRDKLYNAFGDPVDTLDIMYTDMTSNPLGHYVGCLIPEFKTKNNIYASLDILFNSDIDIHNMMLAFNTDLLYEYEDASMIDLSGRRSIPTQNSLTNKTLPDNGLSLYNIFMGTAKTRVLGNLDAPVVADEISIFTNVSIPEKDTSGEITKVNPIIPFNSNKKNSVGGTLYVTSVKESEEMIKLEQVGTGETVNIYYSTPTDEQIAFEGKLNIYEFAAKNFGVVFKKTDPQEVEVTNPKNSNDKKKITKYTYTPQEYIGTYYSGGNAFSCDDISNGSLLEGPQKVITSITNLEYDTTASDEKTYMDLDSNLKVSFLEVQYMTASSSRVPTIQDGDSVYGSSVSFINYQEANWNWEEAGLVDENIQEYMLVSNKPWDSSLLALLKPGDCMLAYDGEVDYNDNEIADDADNYLDTVYVQEVGTRYYIASDADVKAGTKEVGEFKFHYVKLSGQPLMFPQSDPSADPESGDGYDYAGLGNKGVVDQYLVRIDNALNQEIGTMKPLYLEGYTYAMSKPDGVGMYAKEQWQKKILGVLSEYKGLRTGLLNKSEIDYRYVIDTFQSFPDASIKKELSYLCKEKQSAFCIANFPSVQTFVKCPYASFTDSKGVFNVEYVVKGCNKKKASSISFSMPDDTEGASFVAFYTPLKFSDGSIDTIVPSAGLVSNLFIEKYMTRQPYYIVAGPNYGRVNASGMIGPDYKYSMDELQIIEPFGVNCMVYRPNFGTFINANQTAKQIPLSALSKVHVRELVIYLMDEVEKVLQAYQWEFNNGRTREAILARANNICARIMANGGLQAYLNIMDESNNTPDIIDNEMAVLSTHIEPGMGCGKMVHELTLYRTGQMASSIAEA